MRRPFVLLLAPLSLFLLSTCSGGGEANDKSKIFRYNELGDVNSLDPAAAADFESTWAVNQLFNGLVEMDDSLRVQPCIAKKWSLSEDGLTYTFTLRDDVKFHDDTVFPGGKGRKVVAADFVYSFERLFNKSVSKASTLVDMIDRDPQKAKPGFEAPNDSTFVIFLRSPYKPFISILTMKYFSVVPKEAVEHYAEKFMYNPVGTGPFEFRNWIRGMKLVMLRNANYFKTDAEGNRLPYLDAVVVNFIREPESAFMQFRRGDLDMLSGMDAINKEMVLEKDGQLKASLKDEYVLLSRPFLKTDYLGVLVDPKSEVAQASPLRDRLVRQALNHAFDRERMVRYLRYNLGTPATAGFLPPVLLPGKKVKGYEYDPERARQLLYEAGYKEPKDMPTVTLYITKQYSDIAEFVRSQWSEIGVRADINYMEPTPFKSAVAEGRVSLFRKSWVGDYPDPENFMALFDSRKFSPSNGSNYSHFSNALFDKLYDRSMIEQNDSIRLELFRQMDQLVINEAPVIPLYYDQAVRLVQKNVEGMTMDPTNLLNLERVRKSAEKK